MYLFELVFLFSLYIYLGVELLDWSARLSDFTFTFHFHALEKEMATHSSVLARRIPGMAEPGGPWGHTELDTTEVT